MDPSWQIALHLARKFNLVFGEDIVFTYGPLGFLYTRLPIAIDKFVYLLFDAFFVFNLGYILHFAIKKTFGFATFLFVCIAVTAVAYENADQWYFFFFLFHLLHYHENKSNKLSLIFSALLSIICFYIKLSLGIVSIVLFDVVFLYLILRGRIVWWSGLTIIACQFALLLISSYLLNVQLIEYVQGSLQIINAYNDSMLLSGDQVYHAFLWIIFGIVSVYVFYGLLLLLVAIKTKNIVDRLDEFLVLCIAGLFLFIVYKNGVVRYGNHVYMFFKGGVFVVCLLFLFLPQCFKRIYYALFAWLILLASFWAINTLPGSYQPYKRLTNFSIFRIKAGEICKYFADLRQYDEYASRHPVVSKTLKEKIGDKTIDVVPVEISQVYFNSLNYNPRPVFQSYSAYNGYLDSLNFRKYLSNNAPDYVLYSLGSIDDRYAFFDETWTRLALLTNFDVVDSFEDQMLLAKRKDPLRLIEGKTELIDSSIGQDITIPKSNSLLIGQFKINYTWLGKIRRLFFKPPALSVTITLENGETFTYKAITTILKGGVLLNKYIDSNNELEIFMNSKGQLNTNIAKVRFNILDSPWGVKNEIGLKAVQYWVGDSVGSQMTNKDSLRMSALFDRFKPARLPTKNYGRDSLRIWVDLTKTHSKIINISGWAFLELENNDSSKTTIVLKSKADLFELPTINYKRGDLLSFYNRSDLKQAAFNASVLKNELPVGRYQIGVHLVNQSKNINTLAFSDKTIDVERMANLERLSYSGVLENTGNFSHAITNLKIDESKVEISGWVKGKTLISTAINLLLVADDQVYRVSTELNPVIPKTNMQLFDSQIPSSELPDGVYGILIEIENPDNKGKFIVDTENYFALRVPFSTTPKEIKVLPPKEAITKGIDQFVDDSQYTKISGWAIPASADFGAHKIEIVLFSPERKYICKTTSTLRPDVTAYFKNRFELDKCGFEVTIQKKALPKGIYQVGIYIHKENSKGKMMVIDQTITKL